MRKFPVILTTEPSGGYVARCPTLQGCYSQGDTVEEALANIREAIELALEDMTANGEPIPDGNGAIFTEIIIAA